MYTLEVWGGGIFVGLDAELSHTLTVTGFMQNPSFAAFAKLCGVHGQNVIKVEDIAAAIQVILTVEGPGLMEFMTAPDLL